MVIFLLDRDEKVQAIFTNNGSPGSCPYYDDVLKEDLSTGTATYEFKIPSNHEKADLVQEGYYIVRKDLDGNLRMFTIMQIEETHAEQSEKYIYAEDAGLELINDIVRPNNYESKNIDEALDIVLQDTRWNRGETDYLGVQNFKFEDYPTVLNALQQLAQIYGGELRFRVEMKNGKVVGRYVDMLQQRGTDTKKRFVYNKDIESIKRTVDMTELVTALIGIGSGDSDGNYTTFKTVDYDKSKGAPFDKPLGQDWVGDEDALQRYGVQGKHIFGVFQYETNSPTDLLNATWNELQKRKNPKITYELDVALLERLSGLEHEKVRLGDTVYVIDETFSPPLYLEARVIQLETSFSDPTKDKCVLGNFKIAKSNITAEMRALQSKLLKKELTWDEAKARADEAIANALDAQNIANTANQAATAAQETANNALNTANTAQQTANTAQQVANTAQQVANTAQQTANNALNVANDAQETANEAIQQVQYKEIAIPKQPTPPENPQINDLWIDTSVTPNVLKRFDGTTWVKITPTTASEVGAVDTTEFNNQVSSLMSSIAQKADLTYVNGQLAAKADKADTYTKTEVDNALNSKVSVTQYNTDINGIVTELNDHESRITQTEQELATKVSQTTYDQDKTALENDIASLETRMTNAETAITQNANEIALKADKTDVYTKTEIDNSLANKADVSTVNNLEQRITNAEAELNVQASQIALKANSSDVYTKSETDNKLATKANQSDLNTTNANVSDLQTRMTNAESQLTVQAGQIASKVNKTDLQALKNGVLKVRYIRDWLNGSSVNNTNHWVEIKVMSGTTNRASGKTPTSNYSLTNASRITDGDTNSNNFAQGAAGVNQYVQIDLGAVYEDIDYIQIWHYYADGRTYNGTKVEVSEDGVTWITVFDSSLSGTYKETADGLIIPINNHVLNSFNTRLATAESSITQQASEIALKVDQSQYNTDISNLQARMTNAESTLTIHANEIATKVEQDGVISAINQSPESIKIQASKIDITGSVTFNSLDPTLQAAFNADGTIKANKVSGQISDSQIASANNWNDTKSTVDNWKFTGKTTINGGMIEADTVEIAALKSGTIDADKISISNDKVTIDSNGVTVTDADFIVKDKVTGTISSAITKTNLVFDHSFELVEPNIYGGVLSGIYYDVDTTKVSDTDFYRQWGRVGTPKVAVFWTTEGPPPDAILFGYKHMLVNSSNYVVQEIDNILPGKTYTLSFHTASPTGLTAGAPKVLVEFYGDDTLISSVQQTYDIPNTQPGESRRHSLTFTVPNLLSNYTLKYLRIKIMTTSSNWVVIDGVQLVLGTIAAPYDSEDYLWRALEGDYLIPGLNVDSIWVNTIYGDQISEITDIAGRYNGNSLIHDHMNGNVSISAQTGDLYLGYANTNYIRSQKEHWMMAGGRVKAGSWIIEAGDLDASNGIVKTGAILFTKMSSTPISGNGALWYGNGYAGYHLYLYRQNGWVYVD
jgi:phage minor structural protein